MKMDITIDTIIEHNITARDTERIGTTVSLEDNAFDILEDYRKSQGDIRLVKLKEIIADLVELSCQKAEKIIDTRQNEAHESYLLTEE
jgi:hypothetical protein